MKLTHRIASNAILVSTLFAISLSNPQGAAASLRVSNDGPVREGSLVRFDWPADRLPSAPSYALKNGDGQWPVQIAGDGTASFLLPAIEAKQSLTFQIATVDAAKDAIQAKRTDNALRLERNGELLIRYQAEPGAFPRSGIDPLYRRSGYIHPVISPAGHSITDDFPPNHLHHHGIWFPWTNTEFEGRKPDFWNMGQGKGKVEFVELNRFWSGPVHGGFQSEHRFVDLTSGEPKTVLHEQWTVHVYASPDSETPYRLFDLKSVQTCATDSPLLLPEYRYGGMGFRGNWAWNGSENCHFLTSNGKTDRVKGHATRANWCHVGGKIDGEWTGLAILCHPENFRAPQPMRIHPSEPFFNFAPQQAGDMSIQPGKPYVSRYRFVVFDGKPDKSWIDRFWIDYSQPLQVEVKP